MKYPNRLKGAGTAGYIGVILRFLQGMCCKHAFPNLPALHCCMSTIAVLAHWQMEVAQPFNAPFGRLAQVAFFGHCMAVSTGSPDLLPA